MYFTFLCRIKIIKRYLLWFQMLRASPAQTFLLSVTEGAPVCPCGVPVNIDNITSAL